jgi:hypothetical protein
MASHRTGRHRDRQMRTLIYKRTHSGDPDSETGVFGNRNCMGKVRGRKFDAVIGIGGIGPEPKRKGIAGKLTWVGIGPRRIFDDPDHPDCPLVTFEHFWYGGERGPLLEERYPALASRMYDKNVRSLMYSPLPAGGREVTKIRDLDRDVKKILRVAMVAPPSKQLTKRKLRITSGECRPKSRGGC